jgi:hypothetical protein
VLRRAPDQKCGDEPCRTPSQPAARPHSATATFKALCIVPKTKGKKLAAAKTAIKKAHCAVGKITKAYSAKVKKGRVISQKPKAGAREQPGTSVKLKVSKGRHA